MCEAAMSIEFGDDRLKQAREGLKESKGTESEWRTAASAFLSLIDDPATAVGYLQKSLEVYPKSALLHYLKGRALAGSDQPSKAAESYQAALKLVPKYVAAKIALAVLQAQQETGYDEAVASLDTILQSNPNNLQALIERARLKARHGKDADGAAADAQRVTGELSDKAGRGQIGWAHLVLAQVSRQKQTFSSMSTALDEAIKSPPPSDSFFAYELAGELMFLYRRADAFHQMKGALELKAKEPRYLQRMARILLDLDDPRLADPYLKAAPARINNIHQAANRHPGQIC
jgi:tetratricopeptide (TPR) repeat protein